MTSRSSLAPSKLFLLACLLPAIPFLATTYPPMVDIPQHAAQIAALREYFSGNQKFLELYELNLLSPYWLGYGISWLLSYICSIPLAIKLTLSIIFVAFPYACALLREQIQAPRQIDWIFLPIMFGFAYNWGFLNFLAAMPVGILFLRSTLRYRSAPSKKGAIFLSLWVTFLFISHVLATAFLCIVAALLLYKNNDTLWSWIKRFSPLTVSIPLGATWLLIVSQEVQTQQSGPWGLGIYRTYIFIPDLLSLTPTIPHTLLSIATCSLPLILGGRLTKDRGLILPFLFYTAWMILGPNYLLGNFFTYNRFNVLGFPLFLLMFDFTKAREPSATTKSISSIIPMFFAGSTLTIITLKNIDFNDEVTNYREIQKRIPQNMRVASLMLDRQSVLFDTPVYLHFPSWYQAENHGIVDFSFSSFFPQLIRYKAEHIPKVNANFVWHPETFDWKEHDGESYDYIITRSPYDTRAPLLKINSELRLIESKPPWQLYKTRKYQPKSN